MVNSALKLNVPGRGLEPPWITPLAPKASASANFATPADVFARRKDALCVVKVSILPSTTHVRR